MEKPASEGIVQSAEQPTADLHKKIRGPLEQLGHSSSTVPPTEQPVLTGGFEPPLDVEDITHAGKEALREVVAGGITRVRVTESKVPLSIASIRQAIKQRFLGRLKKAA